MAELNCYELNEEVRATELWACDGITDRLRAQLFMNASIQQKLAYAEKPGERLRFNGKTMTDILLRYQASFISLDEPWVDKLL